MSEHADEFYEDYQDQLDDDQLSDELVVVRRWPIVLGVGAAVAGCAAAGTLLTDPDNRWYRWVRKPDWQPPAAVFPIVWTGLYVALAAASAATLIEFRESGRDEDAAGFQRALGLNLVLNAGWSGLFFRAKNPPVAALGAAALAASSVDLTKRAAQTGRPQAVALGAYAAWCSFATALSGRLASLNPRG